MRHHCYLGSVATEDAISEATFASGKRNRTLFDFVLFYTLRFYALAPITERRHFCKYDHFWAYISEILFSLNKYDMYDISIMS